MASRSTALTATALTLLTSTLRVQVHAQYANGAAVASCADLECNLNNSSNLAHCSIQDREYTAIGAVPFKSPFNSDANLTWTEGSVFEYPSGIAAATFVRDYFLGVPPDLDLQNVKGYHGCAAFFVDSNSSFPLYQPPGTCGDTIGGECVKALQDRAGDVVTDDSEISSADELCGKMEQAFTRDDDPPEACKNMSLNGKSWGRIMYRSLTGPLAPNPQPASSCNPALNNTANYNFAHILNFNATRGSDPLWNSSIHSIYDKYHPPSQPNGDNIYDFIQHQAVPILSVFTGSAGVHTAVSCLEAPIEFSQSQMASDDDEGAAGPGAVVSRVGVAVAVLGALFWTL